MSVNVVKQLGLIGYPLSHSFSKKYFGEKFIREDIEGYDYELFSLESITQLPSLIEQYPNLLGLNVTIPYKQEVIPYLDDLSDAAKEIGAVNTIRFIDGKKVGFNTDVIGFENSLQPLLKPHHTKALILGTGGAAKAVEYTLKKLGIHFAYVSRRASEKAISYQDLNEGIIEESTLIVNTTPLGMYPKIDDFPSIPYEYITENHLLYDLVYNPEITSFMSKGNDKGAVTKNGLDMLIGQAEAAWKIWNGIYPS